MNRWCQTYIEDSRITLIRLNTFIFAISQLIVDSLVKGFSEFFHTFTLKVYQTIDAFNLTEEHLIFLAIGYRA